jgi:acyl-CoA thioesterase
MAGLEEDTAVDLRDGNLSATLSRDWEIWGPNGGYIASIALRAAGKVVPPDHRPATFSCQYLSVGQFAPVAIEAEPVRKGRNVWCTNVAISQNEKRLLQAQVWTTNKQDGPFLDFARALVMIDTYPWPAFGRGFDTYPGYVAPTLDVTAWFHTPPGDTDWFLADARADVAANGLIHGTVDIWSEDGRAIATGGSNLLVVQRDAR